MTPSDQFVADARANCVAQLAARELMLRQLVNARVARQEATESAMAAYRDAVVEHVMRRALYALGTFPDGFPEDDARCVPEAFFSGLDREALEGIADDVIHPPLDQLH